MVDDSIATIPIGEIELEGELIVPGGATGIVVFAHGSGSSRLSPRNNFVAQTLHERGLGTLLFDLLTEGGGRQPGDAVRHSAADPSARDGQRVGTPARRHRRAGSRLLRRCRTLRGRPVATYQRGVRVAADGRALADPGDGRECGPADGDA